MASYNLKINGKAVSVTVDEDTPLLWVLRDELNLVGTKFGCGIAQCGACTVHLDGIAVRSCSIPVASLEGANITTIEGLAVEVGPLSLPYVLEESSPPRERVVDSGAGFEKEGVHKPGYAPGGDPEHFP